VRSAPYTLLSTTSPLVQRWYSRARGLILIVSFALEPRFWPLFSYPVVIEPFIPHSAGDRMVGGVCSVAILAVARVSERWKHRVGFKEAYSPNVARFPGRSAAVILLPRLREFFCCWPPRIIWQNIGVVSSCALPLSVYLLFTVLR